MAAKEKALGPDHYDVGVSVGNIAVYLDDLGRLTEAIENIRRATEIVERGLGPDHPRTGLMLANFAEFLGRAGRWEESATFAQRALAIFEREAREDGVLIFFGLATLGLAYLGAGRLEEALPLLERADRIAETHAPTPVYRAQTRFAFGRALHDSGRDRDKGEALVRTARQEYAAAPSTPAVKRELTAIDAWLAARAGARWRHRRSTGLEADAEQGLVRDRVTGGPCGGAAARARRAGPVLRVAAADGPAGLRRRPSGCR